MNKSVDLFDIFPWDEQFATGIEKIDEQHKKLVNILNRLAANQANLANEEALGKIFDELVDYTDYHFKTEEGIWDRHFGDDVWFKEHEKTHAGFIDKILTIKNNPDKTFDQAIYDLILFLAEWLAYHILDTDKRMARVVLEIDAGFSLEEAKELSIEYMNGSIKALIQTVLKMYSNISTRTLDLMREKALRFQAEEALMKSEEKWKFVLNSSGENIWDYDIEKEQVCISKEECDVDAILNKSLQQFEFFDSIHPHDVKQVREDFLAHLFGESEFYHNQHRVLRKDGGWTWVLSRGKVLQRGDDGMPKRIVGIHSDITENELSAIIYQNSSQAMFISDPYNKIISINPAFTKITQYEKSDVIGKDLQILFTGESAKELYKAFQNKLLEEGQWSGEVYNKRKNEEEYPQELQVNAVKNMKGEVDHYIGFFSDISERKRSENIILKQANFDTLTDLENRRMFTKRLNEAIHDSKRLGDPFAVLFIDLDHFKDINDTLGHQVGDAILIEVANRIKNEIRETDVLSRFGGDEFTLLLRTIKNTNVIDRIAQSIIESIKKPFKFGKSTLYISASIGITFYPDDAEDASGLLRNADQAMYQAKHSGRSQYHYFTEYMQVAAQKRQKMLFELHRAIDREEFEVYYQPIVDAKTEKVLKAEALVRWNHPEEGLIFPNEFIPLAEETGMIIEIGDWVYKQAVMQVHRWHQNYDVDFKISVNKSPAQFGSPTTLNEWLAFKEKEGIDSKKVIVEITENLLMKQDERVDTQLLKMRDAGIEVALDDFGTGYSSLSYLKKFSIDYLKIDKSFVDNIVTSSQDKILCEAMIAMAHKLDMRVIAEGVETQEQLEILREMECDCIQGYFYSKPIPASEFEKLFIV